jgi:hypothetical protein
VLTVIVDVAGSYTISDSVLDQEQFLESLSALAKPKLGNV